MHFVDPRENDKNPYIVAYIIPEKYEMNLFFLAPKKFEKKNV